MSDDPRRFIGYLDAERNASLLYRALAESTDGEQREALLELADVEDKHAQHWVDKLTACGVDVPPAPTVLNADDEQLVRRARSLGLVSVLDTLEQNEGADAGMYDDEPEALPTMPSDEREHADVFRTLKGGEPERFPHRERSSKGGEPWHRADKSGSVRAAVFGVSDGLVSNVALILGIAGASTDGSLVRLAGVSGLLAGAISMAAGEWVSVRAQNELIERELEIERRSLAENPEAETRELAAIFRDRGLDPEQAAQVAEGVMSDPDVALDVHAREELGVDPDGGANPFQVALASFVAFAIGALVPLLPWFVAEGNTATTWSVALGATAAALVGWLVGTLTERSRVRTAIRQVLVAVLACGATYTIGSVLGVSVS